MKKYACIVLMMFSIIMYSQTKKNGTVYLEHPAIEAVEAMQQADIAGDVDKVASYLADDFKAYSGTTLKKDDKGTNKEDYLKWVKNRKDWTAYRTLTRHGEAYPDAIEYKDGKIWVQTWNYLKGVHDKTGIKIEMPLHNLYRFNDDNKIDLEIYYNHPVGQNIREAFNARTNGTIYNEHEYINKVRRMVAALENSDVDKGFSYFTEDAEFYNLDMGFDESHSLEEEKNGFTEMLKSWDIESIDVVGYPDYLEYEKGGAKVVQSWWDFRVKRKSDGKQVRIPVMLTHDFNDDGMITREIGYYTTRKMEDK
ncbi:nuclear transport factor 2 family protein [Gaetbulibacter saemankumensis]|uniref:nuclear transport factor 2 family protein n=1 Tax=Gaetbulibacter saemankumensis TaxID=311208 RepID=UPI000481D90D|nr:nuclear transport factor 2 family protein [Gaetbulibacter saemankumensis]